MASRQVNIGGSKDEFYRYKMPALQSKIEGRGNGIKTVVVNLPEIARALERPLEYVLKYFGYELAAQSRYTPKDNKSVVNGAHENGVLVATLNKFIKTWVLCGNCSNPETVMGVGARDDVTLSCKACGHVTTVDPREKLCTYVIRFPPGRLDEAHESSATSGKKSRKHRNEGTSAQAPDQSGIVPEDDDETAVHPRDRLNKYLAEQHTDDEVYMELINMQDVYEMEVGDMVCLIFECLVRPAVAEASIVAAVKKSIPMLRRFVREDDSSAQKVVLRNVEDLLSRNGDDAFRFSAHVLKELYDNDVLSEPVALKWAARSTKKKSGRLMRENAAQFINWLREADEESSDEDEDEDDDDDE